ncbi:TPA: carboxymuconolactone decarboxylase family protein [Klebsiella pneumoniae]|nr:MULTISPECIES: carboxymuconolactone decarboxylase family protein [Klebsiella]HBQ6198014.1 carboxymuconolactone decarboxylase family protein [Klebsiella variicola subsp. variicola]MBA6167590.1 carboxymuconolactone decarboxylase family protein [Klebsiella variicola]MBA6183290.1 carboxymuconolactone decarboxylase family protein [Klebsiella variicola]MCJ3091636.1 carboxymuconolactone decarboxylase family protein [Klebsiella quasipneumoniae]MCJ6763176.1 carboxymuconolactone decarboxylase family p
MSRLHTITEGEATGKTAQLFCAIKGSMGKVPNAYLTIGTQSPEILGQMLQLNAALHNGSLSARELEAINLAVSEESGCDYCLAAHTLMAKKAGYTEEQTRELRDARFSDDEHIDALVKFVQYLVSSRGTVAAEHVEAFRQAGFSDQQVVETIGAVSAILFTNMVNRVNDTLIDFPKVN